MQCRPITFLVLVMLALLVPNTQTSAAEFRKLAKFRISMTIVDSCEVDLARQPSGAAAEDARVECSSFMPHQLTSAAFPAAPSKLEADRPERLAFPQQGTMDYLAALSPADAGLFSSPNTVTVVTVTF